jgi:hypothetical protein
VDEASLDELIGIAFDFLCTRRVNELVDVERILAGVDLAGTAERQARITARFVAPARERLLALARASEVRLGAWLPEPAQQALAAFLERPTPLPRDMVEEMVNSDRVRESVRTMLQEAVTSVLHRAPGGRGLRSVMSLGAKAFGGLGEDLVREIVDGGVGLVQKRIVERLTSEETARSLGRRKKRFFLDLMKMKERTAARYVERTPFALLDALLPAAAAHNLSRNEFRSALRTEIAAVLAELSKQTVGEFLDELGLRAHVREDLRRVLPLIAELVASPAFTAWRAKAAASRS